MGPQIEVINTCDPHRIYLKTGNTTTESKGNCDNLLMSPQIVAVLYSVFVLQSVVTFHDNSDLPRSLSDWD